MDGRGNARTMRPACPWLPEIGVFVDFRVTRRHGDGRGGEYYLDALRYAQSQWMAGNPAQALLQLNKAWLADLSGDEPVLEECPPPYRALVWILEESADGKAGFLGNPVRHFQHLATRMNGVRREQRLWRAWCCFHLSEMVLARAGYGRDGEQLAREGVWVPGKSAALSRLESYGWPGEADLVGKILTGSENSRETIDLPRC